MTIALAAVGAALATLRGHAARPVARPPLAASPTTELTEVVRELEARMDDMVRELTEHARALAARRPAHPHARRARRLDRPRRGAARACSRRPARSTASTRRSSRSLAQPGGQPIVATLGLSAEEAERQAVLGPPDGREARAISMSYDYGAEQDARRRRGDPRRRRGPAARARRRRSGSLTIFTRALDTEVQRGAGRRARGARDAGRAGDRERAPLPRGAPARRPRRADRPAQPPLLPRDARPRGRARAPLRPRSLALIIFDLDDFKAINDRIGHLSGDGVLAEAAERIREVVRSADIACRVGGDEFAVILPESTARGRRPALRAAAERAVVEARSGRPAR